MKPIRVLLFGDPFRPAGNDPVNFFTSQMYSGRPLTPHLKFPLRMLYRADCKKSLFGFLCASSLFPFYVRQNFQIRRESLG
jgi:hypothetical protein